MNEIFERLRADMPQVTAKELPGALKQLKDMGVKFSKGQVAVGDLKPYQEDLIKVKVRAIMAKKIPTPESVKSMKPVTISSDNYIVDGHHRWAAVKEKYGADTVVPVIKLNQRADQAVASWEKVEI